MKTTLCRMLVAVGLFGLAHDASAVSLTDNFDDGVIDSSIWNVSTPFGSSQVVEAGGFVSLVSRGTLSTVDSFSEALVINGRFRINNVSDNVKIVFRSDLSEISGFAELGGLVVEFNGGGGTFIAPGGGIVSDSDTFPPPTTYPSVIGEWYDFRIVDTGSVVNVYLNNALSPILSATTSHRTGEQVAFYNREFGGLTTDLDSVTIATGAVPPTVRWAYDAGGGVNSPALSRDGAIYFYAPGFPNSQLVAVNPNGTFKGSLSVAGASSLPPAIRADGKIYFADGPNIRLADPSLTLGSEIFFASTQDVIPPIAIGADGTIYFGTRSPDSKLVAVREDGTLRWEFPTTGSAKMPSVAPDGTVYFNDGRTVALTPEGQLKWAFPFAGDFGYAAIGRDREVYVQVSGKLYALEPESLNPNGTKRWEYDGTSSYFAPVIDRDGNIYTQAYRALHKISPDGNKLWEFQFGADVSHSSAAIGADGTIYVGSDDRFVYAINPDGNMQWRFETEGFVQSSPVIGSDGTIYVGSNDGRLYALEGGAAALISPWPTFGGDTRFSGRARRYLNGPYFEIQRAAQSDPQFFLIGDPGQPYRVEFTSDFLSWEHLGDVQSANGASLIVDPDSADHKFFRAIDQLAGP